MRRRQRDRGLCLWGIFPVARAGPRTGVGVPCGGPGAQGDGRAGHHPVAAGFRDRGAAGKEWSRLLLPGGRFVAALALLV